METLNYSDILKQTHTLIAGTTGSGKSVLINGIMLKLADQKLNTVFCHLIDLKKVELIAWKKLPHTLSYSDNISSAVSALSNTVKEIEKRYSIMQMKHLKICPYAPVYVIIDELADLMTVAKKDVLPLLQRIGQIGRAANVHMIAATQCPLATVIPTSLKVNFTCIIGLKTRSKQDSRNILGITGCEELPMYGYGYVLIPGKDITLYSIPYVSDSDVSAMMDTWKNQVKLDSAVKVLLPVLILLIIVCVFFYFLTSHFLFTVVIILIIGAVSPVISKIIKGLS